MKEIIKDKKTLVNLFVSKNDIPKYILGRTPFSQIAHKLLKAAGVSITAYIDEVNQADEFDGLPVLSNLQILPSDAIVLIGIANGLPYTVWNRVSKQGIACIDYFSLIHYGGIGLEIPYWEGFHDSYKKDKDAYDRLYTQFADEESKLIYSKLLDFRLNYHIEAMSGFVLNISGEYFEPFLQLQPKGESFCDVGGWNGSTTIEFIKHCPEYDKIYYFEPEPEQMESSKEVLSSYGRIEYCQCAAYDKKDTLRFFSDGSASMVADDGALEVRAERIDDIVNTPVTFIKMDIEGSEAKAIKGAKETILKYHPRLAICVYHKGTDFIDIPRCVLEIRNDYDIYLRHYTEGITESVMFFIPRKK